MIPTPITPALVKNTVPDEPIPGGDNDQGIPDDPVFWGDQPLELEMISGELVIPFFLWRLVVEPQPVPRWPMGPIENDGLALFMKFIDLVTSFDEESIKETYGLALWLTQTTLMNSSFYVCLIMYSYMLYLLEVVFPLILGFL